MRKNKIKKILLISLITLLAIGTLGMSLAFFGKDDFNWAKGKIEDAFVKEEEPTVIKNLIYNSDFSINTSGTNSFTNDNSLLPDGWRINTPENPTYQLQVTSSGLYAKLDEAEISDNFDIAQLIMASDLVIGQTVTMSISVDGVVYSKTVTIADEGWNYKLNTENLVLTLVHSFDSTSEYIIRFLTGFEGTINWVQLEQGSVFTGYTQGPAEYVNPAVA